MNTLASVVSEDKGDKSKLIELIHAYPEIYDKAHLKFYHTKHKAVIWHHLTRQMGFHNPKADDIEAVKKIWGNLRWYFHQLVKKHISCGGAGKKSGSAGDYAQIQEAWRYYQEMSFMRPYLYLKQ